MVHLTPRFTPSLKRSLSGDEPNTLGVAVVVVAIVEVDMVLVFAGAFPLLVDAMVVAGGASELQVFVEG